MSKDEDMTGLIASGFIVLVAGSVYLVLKAFGCFEEGEKVSRKDIIKEIPKLADDDLCVDGPCVQEPDQNKDIEKKCYCGDLATTACSHCGDPLCQHHIYGEYCRQCDDYINDAYEDWEDAK